MQIVATQAKGTISGSSTVTAGGGRAHSYRVQAGDNLLEYTFVLRGMREYELLCRRPSNADDAACKQLLSSFKPTSGLPLDRPRPRATAHGGRRTRPRTRRRSCPRG